MVELKNKALTGIFMFVTDNMLHEIVTETSHSRAWKKFEVLYSGKSLTNQLCLKKWLYNLRMVDGTPIKKTLDEFN